MLCRLDVGVPNPCVYIYACIRMITYAFCFGKKNVFRLEMKESREDFFWRGRGRGRTFHIEGLKTEKAREPNVERGSIPIGSIQMPTSLEGRAVCRILSRSSMHGADSACR